MNKLKIRNMAIFAGGLVLSGTISYNAISNIFNLKPFTQNNYSISKIGINVHTKNGVLKDDLYGSDKFARSILIKTPYYLDSKGVPRRDVYYYDINQLSKEDINFIMNNIQNQDLILDNEFMSQIINSDFKKNKYLTFFGDEITNCIPNNNDFEIAYTEYIPNSNEVINYTSKLSDMQLNAGYMAYNLINACILYVLIFGYDKNKSKKL